MMDDDGSFVKELVDLFVTDSAASMSELQLLLQSNDLTTARQVAHRIKGSALSIGANRLAALASDIEGTKHAESMNESTTRLVTLREETISELIKQCS